MTFPALIRIASEQGSLKGDWTDWQAFREMRTITSHSYAEAKALQVAAAIPAFLAEAEALVEHLMGSTEQ